METTFLIRVLVVEDSKVIREFLVQLLSRDPRIEVIGTANNGEEALEAVSRTRPDVITMDLHMPMMDGLQATRRIMETHPTPIIVVSGSTDPAEVATTFLVMEAGAVAVLRRPAGIGHPDHEATSSELLTMVHLMSEVKVVRRWPRASAETRWPETRLDRAPQRVRVVAIGASTGGPPALQTILAGLPREFPVPLLIVQHMASGFIRGFGEWLGHSCRLNVQVAIHGAPMLPGHAYLAPDEFQMKVARDGTIKLTKDQPENGLRPSVAFLFRSLGEVFGSEVVAGLLTGMGRDGAEELNLLGKKGAVTFAQDKESSVVHGMPGEAIRLNPNILILPPERIAGALVSLTKRPAQEERL